MGLGCEWHHARKQWAEEFGDFEKNVSWDLALGQAVKLGAMGGAARLLGQSVEILTLGEASPAEGYGMRGTLVGSERVGCGRCRNSQHSKNCVSLLVSKN